MGYTETWLIIINVTCNSYYKISYAEKEFWLEFKYEQKDWKSFTSDANEQNFEEQLSVINYIPHLGIESTFPGKHFIFKKFMHYKSPYLCVILQRSGSYIVMTLYLV